MQEYKLRYLPMFYDDFEEIKKMTEDLHFIKTIVAILVIMWILGIACAILFVTGAFRYIL